MLYSNWVIFQLINAQASKGYSSIQKRSGGRKGIFRKSGHGRVVKAAICERGWHPRWRAGHSPPPLASPLLLNKTPTRPSMDGVVLRYHSALLSSPHTLERLEPKMPPDKAVR
jgi:hypothetical protein